MPLTYASTEDFIESRDLKKSGIVVDMTEKGREKIETYLSRATRFIQRHTRRDFFPWRETRNYPVPYAFHDLSIRKLSSSHLIVDQDLLEIKSLNSGSGIISEEYYYPVDLNIKPHFGIAIKPPKFWGGQSSRYDQAVVEVDAVWGYAENTGGWRYPADFWLLAGLLEQDINGSQTSINFSNPETVYDAQGYQSFYRGRLIKIDEEFMEITSVDSAKITVIRGARGTSPAAHLEGTQIYRWKVIEDITEACLQIAKIWREADIAAGGRIGVSDVSSGAELSIPTDPLTIIKSYYRTMSLE